MQRDAVGHHYHVLPFVSEDAERLWGEGVGERKELQSVMYAFFRTLSLWNTYSLDGVNVILALYELPDDRAIVEWGR